MLNGHHDYRAYLKGELVARTQRNPAYSLRLFAMELGLSPSTLSDVMSGKKNISFRRAVTLGGKLGLAPGECDYFCTLVQLAGASGADEKRQIARKLDQIQPKSRPVDLGLEYFSIIADWYHLPILALADAHSFVFTPKNIAAKIGISVVEAEVAVDRLLRVGLLVHENGKYRKSHEHMRFDSPDRNEALRRFHKQMLGRAIDALETQTNDEKLTASQTFAFDPAQLPAVAARVRDFLADLMAFADEGRKKTEVYHLALNVFNVKGDR